MYIWLHWREAESGNDLLLPSDMHPPDMPRATHPVSNLRAFCFTTEPFCSTKRSFGFVQEPFCFTVEPFLFTQSDDQDVHPLSSQYGTYKTVRTWLSGENYQNL